MAILTKFLQLLKPERNDYVDVEKHLSENYDKIDTKMEELSNSNDEKLNKGAVSSEYDTAKKIEDKIKGINEKFKNFCPYAVGDIYITTKSENPTSNWLGTTWKKIEGRFLLGTSNSQASKLTGGSMNKNISQANLPNVKLTVNSFSLGRGTQEITGYFNPGGNNIYLDNKVFTSESTYQGSNDGSAADSHKIRFRASANWTGVSTPASPQTSALGSGQALDITPSFYTTHMWLRTS